MQKTLMIIIIFLCTLNLKAQNLIVNPSFEQYHSCPTNISQLWKVVGWYNPTHSTPDFFHVCNNAINGEVGVPQHLGWGYQYPHSEDGYMGLCTGWPLGAVNPPSNYREYALTRLSSPLVPGQRYCFSFYIALNFRTMYAIDKLGAYFSMDSIYIATDEVLPYTPQAVNPSGLFLQDTTGWEKITWEFTADSAYRFMTFGNFYDYNNTGSLHIRDILPMNSAITYYYFDDFGLYPIPDNDLMKDTFLFCSTPIEISTPGVYDSYLWSTGATTNTIIISTPGMYWLEVSTGCGTFRDSFNVTNIDTTIAFVIDDIDMICSSPVTVNGGNFISHLWSTGETTNTITIATPGVYWAQVTNGCGTYADTFSVIHVDTTTIPFTMPDLRMICGSPVTADAGDYDVYLWSTGATTDNITITTTGSYWVSVVNGCGTYIDTFLVDNIDTTKTILDLPDSVISCKQPIMIYGGVYNTYLWSTGSTEPYVTIPSPGIYWLTISNNCRTFSDTFSIEDGGCFYIPSVFTPNKDGLNDLFRPRGIIDATGYGFHIYNRFGEQVFTTTDVNAGWDGTYKGVTCDLGVYYWHLGYSQRGKAFFKKGSVTLLK